LIKFPQRRLNNTHSKPFTTPIVTRPLNKPSLSAIEIETINLGGVYDPPPPPKDKGKKTD